MILIYLLLTIGYFINIFVSGDDDDNESENKDTINDFKTVNKIISGVFLFLLCICLFLSCKSQGLLSGLSTTPKDIHDYIKPIFFAYLSWIIALSAILKFYSEGNNQCKILYSTNIYFNNFGNWSWQIIIMAILMCMIYKTHISDQFGDYGWLATMIVSIILFALVVSIDTLIGWGLGLGTGEGENMIDTLDIYRSWISGTNINAPHNDDDEDDDDDTERSAFQKILRLIGLIMIILIPLMFAGWFCSGDRSTSGWGEFKSILCSKKMDRSFWPAFVLILCFSLFLPLAIQYLFSDDCFFKDITKREDHQNKKYDQLHEQPWECMIEKYGGLHNLYILIIWALVLSTEMGPFSST